MEQIEKKYNELKKKMWLKHAFDRILALIFLILTLPFFIVVAILIKVDGWLHPESRGGIFYREPRISAGKPFQIVKFRTVTEGAIEWVKENPPARTISAHKDTTWAGRFILKWYLDELPQLWNVLKGEMSIVGPRPHIIEHHEDEIRQGCLYRNYLKGGILGIPQACKGYSKYSRMYEEMLQKHRSQHEILNTLDGLYARKCLELSSWRILLFDLALIFEGIVVILAGDPSIKPPSKNN